MVMLLGSRGRARVRSSSGFGAFWRGVVELVAGKASGHPSLRRRDPSRSLRSATVSRWLAIAAALLCFVGGFFAGGTWADARAAARQPGAGLKAEGTAPGFIGEFDATPLSSDAFIVSVYPNLAPEVAKARAKALADHLRGRELAKARPYLYPNGKDGPLWVVAVYYDGEAELAATQALLTNLPDDVPDETFVHLRKSEAGWPRHWPIR